MEHFRVLIVDDEQQSRSLIKKLLIDYFPQVSSEEAASVAEAAEQINLNKPNLVFLDIQMRGETGFDLLEKTGKADFGIIFTTAHSEFALKAFRYNAMDYLIKPIDADEFRDSVEKSLTRIRNQQSSTEQVTLLKEIRSGNKNPDKIAVPTTDGFLLIQINEIIFCRAAGNYTEFHLSNSKKIISSYTLGYYSDILGTHHFFRVHRSHLVNLAHIRMYKKGDGGTIVMTNGEEIEVSRNNKDAFLKIFNLRV